MLQAVHGVFDVVRYHANFSGRMAVVGRVSPVDWSVWAVVSDSSGSVNLVSQNSWHFDFLLN